MNIELEAIKSKRESRSRLGFSREIVGWRVVYAGTKVLHPAFDGSHYKSEDQALEAIRDSKWNNQ